MPSLRRIFLGLLERRSPSSNRLRLSQRNIYILPTGAGFVFGLLLLILLLTAINYQNSLIYLTTFLLGSLFVATMHQTHRNLAGLEITFTEAGEGFPGTELPYGARLRQTRNESIAVHLIYEQGWEQIRQLEPDTVESRSLSVMGKRRGPLRLPLVRIETRYPLGLLRAWSYIRPSLEATVFPKPIAPSVASDELLSNDDGEGARMPAAGRDMPELRPWRRGDLLARVQWKRYARDRQMVVADWSAEQADPLWLDYDSFPGADTELRLSYLAYLIEEKSAQGALFGLRLPGVVIAPEAGPEHAKTCLRALALYGFPKKSPEPDNAGSVDGQ